MHHGISAPNAAPPSALVALAARRGKPASDGEQAECLDGPPA